MTGPKHGDRSTDLTRFDPVTTKDHRRIFDLPPEFVRSHTVRAGNIVRFGSVFGRIDFKEVRA